MTLIRTRPKVGQTFARPNMDHLTFDFDFNIINSEHDEICPNT